MKLSERVQMRIINKVVSLLLMVLVIAFINALPVFAQGPNIVTVAGDGFVYPDHLGRYFGDGVLATVASFDRPGEVVFDASGNMYILDNGNQMVRKVDTGGIIRPYAGVGPHPIYCCFSGDGGPATLAYLDNPSDIATDADGNLYIADYYNHRVRKVDTNGIISTYAGSGPVGPGAGDYSGDGGPAHQARLNGPSDVFVALDGTLYITDHLNGVIRKVSPGNQIITTVVPPGILYRPRGISLDKMGSLYIADRDNNVVRKMDNNGNMTIVAGDGYMGTGGIGRYNGDNIPAIQASLAQPVDVEIDDAGNIYISDKYNHRIRKVDTSTPAVITTVAGDGYPDTGLFGRYAGNGGPAIAASLNFPDGVFLHPSGSIYIADYYNHVIRMVLSANHPPVITDISVNRGLLWPPNHKMVPVTVSVNVSDPDGDLASTRIISVTSNEPTNGLGDGDLSPDWIVTGDLTVALRAERSGNGTGRIYTITVQCTDLAGNYSTKSVLVMVPHDQGK
jgi:sugar lactone lactonase YvrE